MNTLLIPTFSVCLQVQNIPKSSGVVREPKMYDLYDFKLVLMTSQVLDALIAKIERVVIVSIGRTL